MPAFQTPAATGLKRQSDGFDSARYRKRQTTESIHEVADASGIARDPTKVGEQYWAVLW